MKIYIIAEQDGNDLLAMAFANGKSTSKCISGKAQLINGNPYSVYNDVINDLLNKFDTMQSKYDCNIIVSTVTSGSLLD